MDWRLHHAWGRGSLWSPLCEPPGRCSPGAGRCPPSAGCRLVGRIGLLCGVPGLILPWSSPFLEIKFLRKEYSFYPPTFHLENFNIAKPKELHNEHLSPPLTVLACEHPLSLSLSSLSPSLVFSPCLSLPFENQRHHNTLSLNSIARIS